MEDQVREIKFRAWNPEIKEMHFSSESILFEKREFYPWCFEIGSSSYPEQGWLFMQYTGLKDKNGKEIYEGDIIETTIPSNLHVWEHRERLTIVFKVGTFCAVNEKRSIPLADITKRKPLSECDECVLIGNIYENIELLTT